MDDSERRLDDADGEAQTLGLLTELLAEEISHGHMDFAHRFHELQRVKNPMAFSVSIHTLK